MYDKSPAKNLNKGYAKQEKSDLMNDNPIASRASGGSFMSQHTQSGIGGSPLMASEAQMKTFDKDGDGKPFEKEDMSKLRSK
tara:strand:+ start:662 stop:907 length:246 start_codon:yes stop_codon:yes gene_type:complete